MANKDKNVRRLKAILKTQKLLPLWSVIHKIQEITADPNFTPQELAKIITADAILTASLLRLVNSAIYGLADGVKNVEQAIIMLGYKKVTNLCTTIVAMKMIHPHEEYTSLNRKELWKHSFITAIASKVIQSELFGSNSSDLFSAGLLANIGRIILDQYFPTEFQKAIDYAYNKQITLTEAERHILRMTHAEVGYIALQHWGLSEPLAQTVRFHHGPTRSHWSMIVNLAYVIVEALGIGSTGGEIISPIAPGVLKQLKVNQALLVKLILQIKLEIKMVMPFLLSLTTNNNNGEL